MSDGQISVNGKDVVFPFPYFQLKEGLSEEDYGILKQVLGLMRQMRLEAPPFIGILPPKMRETSTVILKQMKIIMHMQKGSGKSSNASIVSDAGDELVKALYKAIITNSIIGAKDNETFIWSRVSVAIAEEMIKKFAENMIIEPDLLIRLDVERTDNFEYQKSFAMMLSIISSLLSIFGSKTLSQFHNIYINCLRNKMYPILRSCIFAAHNRRPNLSIDSSSPTLRSNRDELRSDLDDAVAGLVESSEEIMILGKPIDDTSLIMSTVFILELLSMSMKEKCVLGNMNEVLFLLSIGIIKFISKCTSSLISCTKVQHLPIYPQHTFKIPKKGLIGSDAVTEYFLRKRNQDVPVTVESERSEDSINVNRLEELSLNPASGTSALDTISKYEPRDNKDRTDAEEYILAKASVKKHEAFKNIDRGLEEDEKHCERKPMFHASNFIRHVLWFYDFGYEYPRTDLRTMILTHLNEIHEEFNHLTEEEWPSKVDERMVSVG